MIIITGTTGTPHITPKQDALWHRGLMGMPTCVFEEGRSFEPEIMNNSTVRIYDGVCSVQGRFMCVEPETYDEVTIDNGTQGQQRIDIICGKLTIGNDGKSTASIEVLKGTPSSSEPAAPTVPETDLDGEDREAYIPLVKVTLNGVVLETVTFIGSMFSMGGKELVWENPDPSEVWESDIKKISVDFSKYKYLEIAYKSGLISDIKIIPLIGGAAASNWSNLFSLSITENANITTLTIYDRQCIAVKSRNELQLLIGHTTELKSNNTWTKVTDQSVCLPIKIYGIK